MQNFKEYTAKTADEAIEIGLKDLNLTRETAEIHVLEEGKKKLFGSVKARVEIAPKKEEITIESSENAPKKEVSHVESVSLEGKTDGERAVDFLDGLFKIMKIAATSELVSEDEKIVINVTAVNNNALIGRKGVLLDAAQTLAGAVANTGREEYKRVVVDCENYRENREETLTRLANNLAQKSVRLGRKIRLEPMNPYERRIIHAALTGNEEVTTESEGKEPNRYIVIVPVGVEDDRPPLYAGNDRREKNDRGGRNYGAKNGRNYDRKGGYNNRSGNNRGGRNFGSNRGRSGDRSSVYKKPDVDFFGTFLGNSGNGGNDEE